MYPREEFPTTVLRPIRNARGAVSLAAIAERFSAYGCPLADPKVAAALIKAGHEYGLAINLAMLAHYAKDLSVDCVDRTANAIRRGVESQHATKFPRGKCAEDMAARREGRPSRWGTAEFHRAP
jgi:hypothetical protein